MKTLAAWPLTLLLAAGLPAACGEGDDDDDTGDPVVDAVDLLDANNYAFDGALDVPTIVTQSGVDLDICWDELVSDIQCHATDPREDIDNVSLIRFRHLSQEDVEDRMTRNDLQQADIDGYVAYENPGEVCTTLSSMSLFGTELDIPAEYTVDGGTYMLVLTTGLVAGVGARMITFLQPSATSANTAVHVQPGCGVLGFTVDLQSLQKLQLPAEGPWSIDWAGLTSNGLGGEFVDQDVDGVMIGYYADLSAADLEESFLDIELLADPVYRIDHWGGTTADLATATDGTSTFAGFSGDGVWVLALMCSRCSNPAPPFLTLVEPLVGP